MRIITVLGLGLLLCLGGAMGAMGAASVEEIQTSLTGVPAPELLTRVATLVKQAKARDRAVTTTNVVRIAVRIKPAAAPPIVGAVARAVPAMAAPAAAAAALEQPNQAAGIARAAAAAAPAEAARVVEAVCNLVPHKYRDVAVAVAEVMPGARNGREILDSVGTALPHMKSPIEQSVARFGGNTASVGLVLDTAGTGYTIELTSAEPPRLVRGPIVEPPYIPLPPDADIYYKTVTTNTPPGGRDYTAP